MLKLSAASPAALVIHAALAVGALTAAGCGDDSEPEDEDEEQPAAKPTLGTFTAKTRLGGQEARIGNFAFDSLEVSFTGLGACDDREVELRAAGEEFIDGETVFPGGTLPSRVPATGADHVVTFTSLEVMTARDALRTSRVEAILRCGDEEIERRTVSMLDPPAVAGVSAQMTATGDKIDDFLVVDDGGVLIMSSTIDADDEDIVHVYVDAFDKDGAPRGPASADLGPLDAFGYGFAQITAGPGGPGIDRLANGSYMIRLHDDLQVPTFGKALIVERDGTVLQTFADSAVLQATVIAHRLMLVRAPFGGDSETRPDYVVDIFDIVSGEPIATDIVTGVKFDAVLDDQPLGAGVVAITDDGVDLLVGGRIAAALLQARVDLAPVRVPFPGEDDDDLVSLAPLPGADDGRFIAAIDRGGLETAINIVKLNATGDGFDTTQVVGLMPGFVVGGGIVQSASQDSLTIALSAQSVNANGEGLGTYMYFRDGGFICDMLSVAAGDNLVTVTDDDLLLVAGGFYAVGCEEEHLIHTGIGVSVAESSNGFVEAIGDLEQSMWLITWLPLEDILPFAEPTLHE